MSSSTENEKQFLKVKVSSPRRIHWSFNGPSVRSLARQASAWPSGSGREIRFSDKTSCSQSGQISGLLAGRGWDLNGPSNTIQVEYNYIRLLASRNRESSAQSQLNGPG